MISESKLKAIIEDVLSGMGDAPSALPAPSAVSEPIAAPGTDECPEDLTAVDLKTQLLVPDPANRDAYMRLKATTPARVGIWRTGPRYRTASMLRFRADHAVAQDAVFTHVPESFLDDWGLFSVQTRCHDKDEFLTRPDLGRMIDDENARILEEKCQRSPKVQIYVSDGLSSTAVEANAMDTFQSMVQGLKGHGIEPGTPFFLRYGRVPAMDAVAEILKPEITVVLIGERPGLATGESMSCYMAYDARVGMPESNRSVISNIHKGGTPAVEAGAHIADLVKLMLDQKASGLNLKKS